MRHLVARRKLNRTSEHRKALRRNMAQSLFEHGQIKTTLTKAKDIRPFVERLITLARRAHGGSLAARQRLIAILADRAIIPADSRDEYDDMSDAARSRVLRSRSGRRHRLGQPRAGQKFTAISVIHHLINNVAPKYADRPGGYTRVIRLGRVQKGDSTPLAVIQLVGEEESPGTVTRPEKTARRRRTERRYAAAAKAARRKGRPDKADDATATKPLDEPQTPAIEATATPDEPAGDAQEKLAE